MNKAILHAAASGLLLLVMGCTSSTEPRPQAEVRGQSTSAEPAKDHLQQIMTSARDRTPKYRVIDRHCQEAAALFVKQSDASASIPFLVVKLRTFQHKHEQSIAMHALIILNDKRAEGPMRELLKHKDPNVFQKAQRVLDALEGD